MNHAFSIMTVQYHYNNTMSLRYVKNPSQQRANEQKKKLKYV